MMLLLHPTPPKQAPPVEGRRAPPSSTTHASSTDISCLQGLPSSSSRQQVPTAAASPAGLPAVNNKILRRHAEQFQALQQQVLEDHLMATRPQQHACADSIQEDDTQLPEVRYAHMSDALLPERTPASFEAWKAGMQLKLQQHLATQAQPSAAAPGQHTALRQQP